MADYQYVHLRGDTKEIYLRVHGKTTVQKGELMIVANDATAIVGATADFYGYPVYPLGKSVTPAYFRDSFVGISMKGKKAGVTEDVPVATQGIFRGQIVPLAAGTSQACKVGQWVYGPTVAAGASVSGVTCRVAQALVDSAIGKVVRHQNAASTVDFILVTKISGTSIM